jgi:hypothetical protein
VLDDHDMEFYQFVALAFVVLGQRYGRAGVQIQAVAAQSRLRWPSVNVRSPIGNAAIFVVVRS